MKRLSLLAVPLLLLGLLTGCGSDDSSAAASNEPATGASSSDGTSASGDAQSVTAFCQVILGIVQQAPQGSGDTDALKLLKSVGAQLEQVGAPADMPEDARRALQVSIDKIKEIPDDATADEVAKAAADLTAAQKKDQAKLGEYVQQTCMAGLQSSATPSPSGN